MVTHDVDEAVLLSDKRVMMSNGPSATIGVVPSVEQPCPRNRVELAESTQYLHYSKAVIDFLYTRQAHVKKLTAGELHQTAGPAGQRAKAFAPRFLPAPQSF